MEKGLPMNPWGLFLVIWLTTMLWAMGGRTWREWL